LRRPTDESLSHLRKAAQRWSEGEDTLAAMHLALSGLAQLQRPEADAYRPFLADGLLKAGFDAEAIIDAIEAGDSALSRVRKYSPDQPRVPAGSGRTSGQWTSTDDAPGALGNSPRPEVNPDTVTPAADQQYETAYACEVANVHCQEAAFYASAGDAANDNGPRNLDLQSCRTAYGLCKWLSIAMQLQPFPLSGGVLFPHRGVVLVSKGRVDRYVPPSGGEFPNLRRILQSALSLSLAKVQKVDSYAAPPWTPEPDETVSSSPDGFNECRKVIGDFASGNNGKILNVTYSCSKQWGKIVRAKIAFAPSGETATTFFTCWSTSPPGVRFDLRFACCGDCAKQ
jgi:hypothetical protein